VIAAMMARFYEIAPYKTLASRIRETREDIWAECPGPRDGPGRRAGRIRGAQPVTADDDDEVAPPPDPRMPATSP